jgi:hypothetical protein
MLQKRTIISALLLALLIFSFPQVTRALPPQQSLTEEEEKLQDNALRFLTDVAMLNILSYQKELFIDDRGGTNYDKTLKFNFTSSLSKVDVLFLVRNNSLFWCTINPVKGPPSFMNPEPSDVLNTAKNTLARLQTFSAKEYLPTLQNMLNTVTELKTSQVSTQDFTQDISVSGNLVRISWEPYANGLSNQQNKLTLEFTNGSLSFFCNYLDFYSIGNADPQISEQQAIEIALQNVKAYPFKAGNETITNVTVIEENITTELTLQPKENNTLYPYWSIWLPLDKMYLGGVTSFHVSLWGDTGEVNFISPIGYYGEPNASPTQDPQTSPLPTQAVPEYNLAIIALITAITTFGTICMIYSKKRKQK